jgi:TDG/mug DNA glycosylase family protein
VDRALSRYQAGEISIGRAAEDAGLTHWDIMALARQRGIAYPLTIADVEAQIRRVLPGRVADASAAGWEGQEWTTLPDRKPRPGGILLVGINPAPLSVAAGHYHQGKLGRRLWRRLQQLGLLGEIEPGAEDDAFVARGHGLTDVVKRPTRAASELNRDEIREGAEQVCRKIREWKPGLIVFVYREAARAVTRDSHLTAGPGPKVEGTPTFLLAGPYLRKDRSARLDRALLAMVRKHISLE